jgi:hypothetical protein
MHRSTCRLHLPIRATRANICVARPLANFAQCVISSITYLPLQYADQTVLTPACTIAVDMRDVVVPAQKTIDLQGLFKNSQLVTHNEGKSQTESLISSTSQPQCRALTVIAGHSIPVRGDWPRLMREFILQACSQSTPIHT